MPEQPENHSTTTPATDNVETDYKLVVDALMTATAALSIEQVAASLAALDRLYAYGRGIAMVLRQQLDSHEPQV